MLNNKIFIISISILLMQFCQCFAERYYPPAPVPDDRHYITKPAWKDATNDFSEFVEQQFTRQFDEATDIPRQIRALAGNKKEAFNVNAFDEVPNSSWFTNRHAYERLSTQELRIGANHTGGPDTSNTWTIIKAKAEGITPGFNIKDSRGDIYVIKFDPVEYPGLNSSCEVIGAKLLYAIGYNVPENYICYFDPKKLKLGEKVEITDEKGRKRYMRQTDLDDILSRVRIEENGLVRAAASKFIEGKVVGPFDYTGRREDDPNDIFPHQHRRELRGYQVVSAWMNNIDAKGSNSMDSYVTENGKSYVRHYLLDFGTFFGSGGRGPQPKYRSYENEFDPKALIARIFTFGLYSPDWERIPNEVEYKSIGRFSADYFHPEEFKTIFPNPAFENMTDRDGYWGAKQVTAFTDDELFAVIESAQFPEEGAAEYFLDVLRQRRDIVGKFWFNRIAPLDRFNIARDELGKPILKFEDMAVNCNLAKAEQSKYICNMHRNDVPVSNNLSLGREPIVPLHDHTMYSGGTRFPVQWKISLRVKRDRSNSWSAPVHVYLEEKPQSDGYVLLGLERKGR